MASILDVCAVPGTLHSATLGGPVAQRQREPLPHSLDHSMLQPASFCAASAHPTRITSRPRRHPFSHPSLTE